MCLSMLSLCRNLQLLQLINCPSTYFFCKFSLYNSVFCQCSFTHQSMQCTSKFQFPSSVFHFSVFLLTQTKFFIIFFQDAYTQLKVFIIIQKYRIQKFCGNLCVQKFLLPS
ncbi:hypothetical protein IMG5_112740 [Ichthyophthirius multifiliis]|uniref:Uncharacterized protein n=1 Tax=Ichthyophthirius multifiliis TaxID=5932 RepID=G0QTX8_ICHMU|nr:hypothetical protein IMG5_112740 [Ichthyophthirius multifiliis]EGR31337.1 hypothetical protein IMG5_112740 [Ichthyophthirius multifiliis]|eukprot:XP_004034823.1 hypothetical protein IMG5_112740 [Ichthyophthirius multifiliis]